MALQIHGKATHRLWVTHGRERSRPTACRTGSRRADRSRPCVSDGLRVGRNRYVLRSELSTSSGPMQGLNLYLS